MIAVLLVGGHSTRMGVDKFAMEINGQPQWKFMVEELSGFFDEVHIACRKDQAPHFEGEQLIFDEMEDIGPMGALFSCFRLFESRYLTPNSIFFVACDLPGFSVSIVKELSAHCSADFDIVAAKNPNREGAEPLIAFWNRSALPKIEQFIAKGDYALYKCMSTLRVKAVEVSNTNALHNINSPEDL